MSKRFLSLLAALITLISIGGIFATWQFATDDVNTASKDVPVSMDGFEYPEIVYITDVDYLSGQGTYT